MIKGLITGGGKIGSLIASLMLESQKYEIAVLDREFNQPDLLRMSQKFTGLKMVTCDVTDTAALTAHIQNEQYQFVISSLPYHANIYVAMAAKKAGIHYFDLTEDTKVTEKVKELAMDATQAFVPQCGLAPGFISIAACAVMENFSELDEVKLRVGALPQHSSNVLQYALTWSTEGVINEYGNRCHAIERGKMVVMRPLEKLEKIQIDGLNYEAFNTSGGLGSLAHSYRGKVRTMNYKTIRYPGHCEKMRVLMNDLRLNEDRETLKRILERAVPKTYQDVVLVYVSVTGKKHGEYVEDNYFKKVYPQQIAGLQWSAIQVTTAASVCCVADMVLQAPHNYQGLILQEQFHLRDFLKINLADIIYN